MVMSAAWRTGRWAGMLSSDRAATRLCQSTGSRGAISYLPQSASGESVVPHSPGATLIGR
jgi:hypothetical protein